MHDNEIINDAAFGIEGFKYRKHSATVFPIDPNIRPLIALLNMHAGIATIGSCGGHTNPNPTQHPAGQWFVSFMIYTGDSRGYEGLDWIRSALRDLPSVVLTEAYNGDTFFLVGKEHELEHFLQSLKATLPVKE